MRQILHFLQELAIEDGDVGLLDSRGRKDLDDLVTGTHGPRHELLNRRGAPGPRRFEPDLPGLALGNIHLSTAALLQKIAVKLGKSRISRCDKIVTMACTRN